MAATPRRDPLAPVEWIVFVLWGLFLLPLVFVPFVVVDAVDGGGQQSLTMFEFGTGDACVAVTNEQVGGTEVTGTQPLQDGASVRGEVHDLCLDDPSGLEQTAASAPQLAGYLLALGAIFLLRRLLRQARRDLFGDATAARTTALGWFLVLGSLGTALAGAWGETLVVRRGLVEAVGWSEVVLGADVAWTLVVVGLGVVTVGRVLRHAVVLQEEVDATV